MSTTTGRYRSETTLKVPNPMPCTGEDRKRFQAVYQRMIRLNALWSSSTAPKCVGFQASKDAYDAVPTRARASNPAMRRFAVRPKYQMARTMVVANARYPPRLCDRTSARTAAAVAAALRRFKARSFCSRLSSLSLVLSLSLSLSFFKKQTAMANGKRTLR